VYPSEAPQVGGTVVPDASSALPGHHFPIEGGALSFLANQPYLNTSSAVHGSSEEKECDSSTFPTDAFFSTANDNTLNDARVANFTTKVFSHDLHTFDSSYVEDFCDSTLPIEHDPDFVNVGACLELGEESDSIVSSDDDNDDDISSSSADGDDLLGPSIFSDSDLILFQTTLA
jgi:hypothetical protein